MTIKGNRGRVDVNVPVKWHTNNRPQFGPAILDTEAATGLTGGYRKARFKLFQVLHLKVDDGDIMTWDSNLGSWINKPGNSVGAGVMQFEYKLDTDSDTGFVTTSPYDGVTEEGIRFNAQVPAANNYAGLDDITKYFYMPKI